MQLDGFNPFYWLFAIALAGCASASVSQQSQSAPIVNNRPNQIVVYPFAVDSADVTLNQSIIQRAYRSMSDQNESADQAKLAHDTAQSICDEVVGTLNKNGYSAICQQRGTQSSGTNIVIVDGNFTNISEGNRLRRLVIGFGAGASVLDTDVNVFQTTGLGTRQILNFNTHADSGKMPGAAVTGGAGAAAGGSAAVIVGANAAMSGAKSYTSATGYLADKTAEQIVQTITQYYAQQGWTPS
ncbi:MAG TPA: DUF4410 domain-containing protein [Candidatus Binataceae bacterium]|nr:DUF4410 domain-containing protein [Candidatus Binataceae bacterium]